MSVVQITLPLYLSIISLLILFHWFNEIERIQPEKNRYYLSHCLQQMVYLIVTAANSLIVLVDVSSYL